MIVEALGAGPIFARIVQNLHLGPGLTTIGAPFENQVDILPDVHAGIFITLQPSFRKREQRPVRRDFDGGDAVAPVAVAVVGKDVDEWQILCGQVPLPGARRQGSQPAGRNSARTVQGA